MAGDGKLRSLDGLKAIVEDSRLRTDAGLFSDVVGEMLNRLHFFLEQDEYISWIASGGFISAQTLRSAKRVKEHYAVIDHVFRQAYANPKGEYIFTARHYDSWEDFQQNRMRACLIVATSDLGMKKRTKRRNKFCAEQPAGKDFEAQLDEAFDAGFIAETTSRDNTTLYYLTPRIIYKLLTAKCS